MDRNFVESSLLENSRDTNINQNVGLYELYNFIIDRKNVNVFPTT